jgi:hypothetical protein
MGKSEMRIKLWLESLKGGDNLEDLGVRRWGIILKRILRNSRTGGKDGTNLAQNRGSWQGLVSTVMKLCVP